MRSLEPSTPRTFRLALLLLAVLLGVEHGSAMSAEPVSEYDSRIKPLLRDRCITCHGQLKQKAGLRLDAGALIRKGSKNGPVVVSGDSGKSELIRRITSSDDAKRMPPETRPLSVSQIDAIRRWIDGGANSPADEPVLGSPAEHWAFQPVRRPAVPSVKDAGWARNPIDAFVLATLEKRGWKPAPAAGNGALLRRVYLDLIGLPPTLAEQERFATDGAVDAIDRVIDDLLARPAYGERWARHWLDVVRYADSNGYERDAEKPYVWRYRDYVIDALNADKPFDRFVMEQLAGDELADASPETQIATGYLRLGHWNDEPADAATDRYDQLDDMVSTTGQAFLGLTIGCARCHDHKFEPLLTRDYYSLVAIFNPLRRPNSGRSDGTLPIGTPAEIAAIASRDAQIARLTPDRKKPVDPETSRQIAALRTATPDLPQAYILDEVPGRQPQTHVLLRGSPSRPGDSVEPAVPAILVKRQPSFPAPDARTSHRRLGLATWIASEDNPLTARVIVNRVWKQHFGAGLVRTPNDFGLMGAPPTNPELLDWLADWFVHDAHGSLKKLHRLILNSNAWRMSREMNPTYASEDPENNLLWHMPLHRLEVEPIRDSMLAVSGKLNAKMHGPAMRPPIPAAAIEANTDKASVWKASDEDEASRRTIYAFIKRGLIVPMFDVFDFSDTVSSCPQRQVTTVAPQALSLFNGEFVMQQSRHLADRLEKEAGEDPHKQIELAWRLALCRAPRENEMEKATAFCRAEADRLIADAAESHHSISPADARHLALVQVCRVIFNLNEFVYPE
jgi:mono/diheme cytochrome c family protein